MSRGKTKGPIRAHDRRGVQSDMSPPVARRTRALPEGAMCERCGAVFSRRTWRANRPLTHSRIGRATWVVCPGCRQADSGEYYGRICIRGAYARAHQEAIRRRIDNTVARARFTQPERQLVGLSRDGDVLEVLTTSQKLAHRVVHELKKVFRGRAAYRWSDDGTLFATWERDDVPG